MSLGQALQLWNGDLVHQVLTDPGNEFHGWITNGVADEEIIRRLYQRGLCRPPTAKELQDVYHLRY